MTLLLFTGCKKSCKDDKNTNTPSKADEIMKNFEEYTINFTITNKDKVTEYFIINSKNGLLYNINEDYYLYQESDQKWYTLNTKNETKQYDSEGNNNKTKIQNMIRTIMVGYLNTVDDCFLIKQLREDRLIIFKCKACSTIRLKALHNDCDQRYDFVEHRHDQEWNQGK